MRTDKAITMFRFLMRSLVAVVAAAGLAGCGGNTATTPTTPTPTTVTETFTGTVNHNGAATHSFVVSTLGTATATLTAISPDSVVPIGMAMGEWNGASCRIVIAQDQSVRTTVITGNVSGAGLLCVRIYDTGNVADTADYELTVTHP
jgi:hypothetical protein